MLFQLDSINLLQYLWFCLGMMVENLFYFSNLHIRNSRVQKNYDFDKVTVVEIQEGSNY